MSVEEGKKAPDFSAATDGGGVALTRPSMPPGVQRRPRPHLPTGSRALVSHPAAGAPEAPWAAACWQVRPTLWMTPAPSSREAPP